MADATLPFPISPEANYATRRNIVFPGSRAAATAAAARADGHIEDRLPSGVTISGLTILSANDAPAT